MPTTNATNTPPFFAQPTGSHCFQASMRSVLKYFLPDRDFSWRDLERMSAKRPGMATWPSKMLISLHELGFDVGMVEMFDGRAFIERGEQYLIETFGREAAAWQIAHSDIAAEQRCYRELYERGITIEQRLPTLQDIADYLARGYLVQCMVNSRKLNHQPGYVGHSVLVYAIDERNVTLHDPGPARPQASRQVPLGDFDAAWASPNDRAKSLIYITYKEA